METPIQVLSLPSPGQEVRGCEIHRFGQVEVVVEARVVGVGKGDDELAWEGGREES